jgi:SpoVK/Ycf46/Vps4 family AAA+-type ATPase
MDGGFGSDIKGAIYLGHPGGGKSYLARAIGNTFGTPTITIDLGAMKGGLVGQSEGNIRRALKIIDGISGGNALVIATCNRLDTLPPELRRRFNLGLWFFDLPSEAERKAIWKLHLKRRGFGPKDLLGIDDTDLTGADIRNACDTAFTLGVSLKEAAQFCNVPVAKADPASVERLRQMAHGKFLSASTPGVYLAPGTDAEKQAQAGSSTQPTRKFDFGDSN